MNYFNQYPYQQPQAYQPMQQQNYSTFIVVNGFQDVERYIVSPNQTVNFYDGKNGYLYLKSADSIGKYSIRAFKLDEIDLNSSNTREPKQEYITRSDLTSLQQDFENKLNDLSTRLEKLSMEAKNNE